MRQCDGAPFCIRRSALSPLAFTLIGLLMLPPPLPAMAIELEQVRPGFPEAARLSSGELGGGRHG